MPRSIEADLVKHILERCSAAHETPVQRAPVQLEHLRGVIAGGITAQQLDP